jgi:hypothetical protein
MNVMFPIIELVDRLTIARVKHTRTNGANQQELDFYLQQTSDFDLVKVQHELEQLESVHNEIWNLEAELKSGQEQQLELSEIGRRAIKIRDWNHKRIALKNLMADKLGQGHIHEIKQQHLSQ